MFQVTLSLPECNAVTLLGAHAVLSTIIPTQYDQYHCICFDDLGIEPECFIQLSHHHGQLSIDRLKGSEVIFESYVKTLLCILDVEQRDNEIPPIPLRPYTTMSCHMIVQCMFQQPYEATDACVVATCRLVRQTLVQLKHISAFGARVFSQYVHRYMRTSESFEVHRQCILTAGLIYKKTRSVRVRKKLYKGTRTLQKRLRFMLHDGIYSRLFTQENERLISDVLKQFASMWVKPKSRGKVWTAAKVGLIPNMTPEVKSAAAALPFTTLSLMRCGVKTAVQS